MTDFSEFSATADDLATEVENLLEGNDLATIMAVLQIVFSDVMANLDRRTAGFVIDRFHKRALEIQAESAGALQ